MEMSDITEWSKQQWKVTLMWQPSWEAIQSSTARCLAWWVCRWLNGLQRKSNLVILFILLSFLMQFKSLYLLKYCILYLLSFHVKIWKKIILGWRCCYMISGWELFTSGHHMFLIFIAWEMGSLFVVHRSLILSPPYEFGPIISNGWGVQQMNGACSFHQQPVYSLKLLCCWDVNYEYRHFCHIHVIVTIFTAYITCLKNHLRKSLGK